MSDQPQEQAPDQANLIISIARQISSARQLIPSNEADLLAAIDPIAEGIHFDSESKTASRDDVYTIKAGALMDFLAGIARAIDESAAKAARDAMGPIEVPSMLWASRAEIEEMVASGGSASLDLSPSRKGKWNAPLFTDAGAASLANWTAFGKEEPPANMDVYVFDGKNVARINTGAEPGTAAEGGRTHWRHITPRVGEAEDPILRYERERSMRAEATLRAVQSQLRREMLRITEIANLAIATTEVAKPEGAKKP